MMKANKAMYLGTLHNNFMWHTSDLIAPHYGPLYQATFTLHYYPQEWKETQTIVLRKPGKDDYHNLQVWRPIVLSKGEPRTLNKCITEDILWGCEANNLLPTQHYGGWKADLTRVTQHWASSTSSTTQHHCITFTHAIERTDFCTLTTTCYWSLERTSGSLTRNALMSYSNLMVLFHGQPHTTASTQFWNFKHWTCHNPAPKVINNTLDDIL